MAEKMSTRNLALVSAGISMLLWVATPAVAGHRHDGGKALGFGSTVKHGSGHHFGTTGKRQGNKQDKDRGLDRANDVAGEHGQQGRANAVTHQSDKDSAGDSE